jgi:hypothetical protein
LQVNAGELLKKIQELSFWYIVLLKLYLRSLEMSKTHSETSEDFEYIETPPAPMPAPPIGDCGVRTTSVSRKMHTNFVSEC